MNPSLEKLSKIPKNQKIALVLLILIAITVAWFYLLYQPDMKELQALRDQQAELTSKIQENKRIADNLPRFKKEYAQLKLELENALTELPNQKEIPSLLTSITSKGKDSGLDFLIFRPKPEVPQDFYSEVPVDITVSGSFFNVANFFVAVGSLPRIVNISNVNVADIRDASGRVLMKVNCLATTFRFLDKKEVKNEK